MAGPFTLIGNADQTFAGKRFVGIQATAAAIPVTNTTSPVACLWNRAGSNVILVPERISFGWVTTTEAPGNFQLNILMAAGSAPGTGLPLTAFTAGVLNTTIFCTNYGAGQQPQGSFGTGATLTTAGVPTITLGMSHLTTTGASTAVPGWMLDYDFKDQVMLQPGTFLYPTASTATASTYNLSIVWREIPLGG